MPRLLTSFFFLLLSALPARPASRGPAARNSRGRRLPSRLGAAEEQDPVEAPDRERARTLGGHQWPGEVVFAAGERRAVVRGRWRLTLDRAQRAQVHASTHVFALDSAHQESWETQLESLLTLQVPGARLQVTHADAEGWRLLELRAPTQPETVVQLDRAAVARAFGTDAQSDAVRVEFRVTS